MRLAPLVFAALTVLSAPALAFDIGDMTEEERAEFGEAVRAFLLENPQVLEEVIDALEARRAEEQAKGDAALIAANAAEIFEDGYSYVGGNPEGTLTVVEFLDYRCGYCRKAHADVKELVRSDGDIRYVVKEFPILGEESLIASRFAIAALQVAGPEAYAKINAGFYESFRGDVTDETLRTFAENLGLDPEPIFAAMNTPEVSKIIETNHLLAQRLRIEGTPTFVIGDQMLRGFAPLDVMRGIVSDARS
jgi:protein-disulfide isomerase